MRIARRIINIGSSGEEILKRRELIRCLERYGFVLERHGSGHDVYVRGAIEVIVPRHREINEVTAKAILKKATRKEERIK